MSAPRDPGREALAAEQRAPRACRSLLAHAGCPAAAQFIVRTRVPGSPERSLYWPCREHVAAVTDLRGLVVEEVDTLPAVVVSSMYRLIAARRGEFGVRAMFAARAAGDGGDVVVLYARYLEQLERLRDADLSGVRMPGELPGEAATTVRGGQSTDDEQG